MDTNDYNLITPINPLQTIKPQEQVERRKERNQKKNKKKPQQTGGHTESVAVERPDLQEPVVDKDDPHLIDYRA